MRHREAATGGIHRALPGDTGAAWLGLREECRGGEHSLRSGVQLGLVAADEHVEGHLRAAGAAGEVGELLLEALKHRILLSALNCEGGLVGDSVDVYEGRQAVGVGHVTDGASEYRQQEVTDECS